MPYIEISKLSAYRWKNESSSHFNKIPEMCSFEKPCHIYVCSDWSRTKTKHLTEHIIWNRTAATTLKEKKEAKVKKTQNQNHKKSLS